MKRITQDKAQNLVAWDDTMPWDRLKYFTITPGKDGWDTVRYYTGRVNKFEKSLDVEKQYVYILSNPSIPGQYKVGYTTGDPYKRANQLSISTSVPTAFQVEWFFPCNNAEGLEYEIHKKLDSDRVANNREFFVTPLAKIIETVINLGRKYVA